MPDTEAAVVSEADKKMNGMLNQLNAAYRDARPPAAPADSPYTGRTPPPGTCPQCCGGWCISGREWCCVYCGMPARISIPSLEHNAEARNRVPDRIDYDQQRLVVSSTGQPTMPTPTQPAIGVETGTQHKPAHPGHKKR